MQQPPTVWDGVLRRLQTELPEFALDAWIRPLTVREEQGCLRLLARSEFHLERIRSRFLELLRQNAQREAGAPVEVQLELAPVGPTGENPSPPEAGTSPGGDAARASGEKPNGAASPQRNGATSQHAAPRGSASPGAPPPRRGPLRVRPAESARQAALPYGPHTFDTFVVGPGNSLAREASLAVAQGRQPGVSPLFLLGPSGTGKSHLARAVVTEARQSGTVRTVYTPAESFTSELLSCIRGGRTGEFKRRYRQECELLVLEDVQFLEGKNASQLELFHTLEHLGRAGGRIVLTADRLPREMPRLDGRLRSWMGAGLVAELETPDVDFRRTLLREKAARGGVRIPDDCLDLLAEAELESVRDLEGVLIQLVASASILKRPVDGALTERALRKVRGPAGEAKPGALDVKAVVASVAAFFSTTPEALASRSRKRTVLLPRQLAMYLCRRYTDAPLAEIGRALDRDHPAVRHAIETVERAILERAPLRYQVEALVDRLEGGRRS